MVASKTPPSFPKAGLADPVNRGLHLHFNPMQETERDTDGISPTTCPLSGGRKPPKQAYASNLEPVKGRAGER
jgi:hypothetical protein